MLIRTRPARSLLRLSLYFHKWKWNGMNNILICLFCRILSCIQAGARQIWPYWPALDPSIRGLVRMWGTNPRKVVTQEEQATLLPRANPLHPAAGFYRHRSCPSRQTLAYHNEKNTTTNLLRLHRKRIYYFETSQCVTLQSTFLYKAVCI